MTPPQALSGTLPPLPRRAPPKWQTPPARAPPFCPRARSARPPSRRRSAPPRGPVPSCLLQGRPTPHSRIRGPPRPPRCPLVPRCSRLPRARRRPRPRPRRRRFPRRRARLPLVGGRACLRWRPAAPGPLPRPHRRTPPHRARVPCPVPTLGRAHGRGRRLSPPLLLAAGAPRPPRPCRRLGGWRPLPPRRPLPRRR